MGNHKEGKVMGDSVDKELHGTVLSIVHEIEAAAEGSLYYDGSGYLIIDDMDAWKHRQYLKKVEKFKSENPEGKVDLEQLGFETYEEWMRDQIGTEEDIEEPDSMSLDEYIEKQALGDVRFEVDSSKQLMGGKVLFCYGGPNVWVHDDEVCGYWGSAKVEMSLNSEAASSMYRWFDEYWDIVKA